MVLEKKYLSCQMNKKNKMENNNILSKDLIRQMRQTRIEVEKLRLQFAEKAIENGVFDENWIKENILKTK